MEQTFSKNETEDPHSSNIISWQFKRMFYRVWDSKLKGQDIQRK